MIENLFYLPVEDPASFVFFMFIPGFLVYYGLLLENKSRLRKISCLETFFGTKIFGTYVDALIWSVIFGILLMVLCSGFIGVFGHLWYWIVGYTPAFDAGYIGRALVLGIFSLTISMFFVGYEILKVKESIRLKLSERMLLEIKTDSFKFCISMLFVFLVLESLLIYFFVTPNPIIGAHDEILPYYGIPEKRNETIEGKPYENLFSRYVVVVNPRDYPITFWVKDDSGKAASSYRYVNSSAEWLKELPILKSKEAFDLYVIVDNCDTKKEGWTHIVTSEGTIPLHYTCR